MAIERAPSMAKRLGCLDAVPHSCVQRPERPGECGFSQATDASTASIAPLTGAARASAFLAIKGLEHVIGISSTKKENGAAQEAC